MGDGSAAPRPVHNEMMDPDDPVKRYRCTACGNLTRFDVTSTRRTRAFHHYSVSGKLTIDENEILSEEIEDVSCRWCGNSSAVVDHASGEDDFDGEPGELQSNRG
jgi:hypothetical protein